MGTTRSRGGGSTTQEASARSTTILPTGLPVTRCESGPPVNGTDGDGGEEGFDKMMSGMQSWASHDQLLNSGFFFRSFRFFELPSKADTGNCSVKVLVGLYSSHLRLEGSRHF